MSEQQKWRVSRDMSGIWRARHPRSAFGTGFRTWEEAMQEADRLARTTTVTLPRLAPGEWTTVGGFRVIPEPPWRGDALEVDELDDDGAYFIIGMEDCEPLALALLAHARKATN